MHEIFEVIFVVKKSAAEVISEVDSDDQPNGWRKAECYQAGIRVDTIGRRILRNSVAVYCPHHIRCDDRFQETTTGKGRPIERWSWKAVVLAFPTPIGCRSTWQSLGSRNRNVPNAPWQSMKNPSRVLSSS